MSTHPSRDRTALRQLKQPERVAWFHCFSGIAGDMALASLIDAGAEIDELRKLLARLPIGGWTVDAVPVLRGGVAATHVVVDVQETAVVRTFPHVMTILEDAKLPRRIHKRSAAAFSALAEVEGRLHRRPTNQVHFHEVGGHDTLIDVVGTAAALEILEVEEVVSSPVAVGSGIVRTSHGLLPNPAPAVLALLAGAPVWGRDLNVELTTPTGAAILAAMASRFGPMPKMTVDATGYGAGTRDVDGLANCTQVVLGRAVATAVAEAEQLGQPLVVLEANLDDATGEQLADAIGSLLEAGANDVWVTPVVMKKGRPGHVIAALCDRALVDQLTRLLVSETGTLGVRATSVGRSAVSRRVEEVQVDGDSLRVKVSAGRIKVEHDDALEIARRSGQPVRDVIERAERTWWSRSKGDPDQPSEA